MENPNIRKYQQLVRRLRNDPRLWDGTEVGDRLHDLLGKALERLSKLREKEAKQQPAKVGPYSGLTREELRQSGTCETDWF